MRITVIGETNIDIAVVREANGLSAGCTPGRIAFHHGGVARNIAHNLSLLGHEVRLMTVFGGDGFASGLIADCKAIGMDLSLSTVFEKEKSPIFLSFNDEIGNIQSAVSDIGLNRHMDLAWVERRMGEINSSDIIVADTLLSVDALACLLDRVKVPLFIDSVSPGCALRLAEALKSSEKHAAFALKCNLAEATALSKETDAESAAKALCAMGIAEVYLTMGENGVIYRSETESRHYPALTGPVVNVAGSGDAFFSGVIHAHALGVSGKETVAYGLEMARINIESDAPVNPSAEGFFGQSTIVP